MFGQQQQPGGTVNGTAAIPFQATTQQDGSSSSQHITFQSITAMPQYQATGKSFEELRFEDYSQGNRGTGSTGAGGAFGATTSAFGGAAPAPATGGLFGSTTTSPAPAPAFSASGFGAPTPGKYYCCAECLGSFSLIANYSSFAFLM
jgi:nuclear pore complex protein Nup98-Nup96